MSKEQLHFGLGDIRLDKSIPESEKLKYRDLENATPLKQKPVDYAKYPSSYVGDERYGQKVENDISNGVSNAEYDFDEIESKGPVNVVHEYVEQQKDSQDLEVGVEL